MLWRVEIAQALVLITWPIVRALVLAWAGRLLFVPDDRRELWEHSPPPPIAG